MNRRAFSPLIATILIIGFIIALSIVVMIWGQTFFEEQGNLKSNINVKLQWHNETIYGAEDIIAMSKATNCESNYIYDGNNKNAYIIRCKY